MSALHSIATSKPTSLPVLPMGALPSARTTHRATDRRTSDSLMARAALGRARFSASERIAVSLLPCASYRTFGRQGLAESSYTMGITSTGWRLSRFSEMLMLQQRNEAHPVNLRAT
jgi:hypothetical protein